MSSFIQIQNENRNDPDEATTVKKPSFKDFLCSRQAKSFIFLIIFSMTVPLLVYYFFINRGTYLEPTGYICLVSKTYRVPCGKINITSKDCEEISCCYDDDLNTCYHYLPSQYYYQNQDSDKFVPSIEKTTLGTQQLPSLDITINEIHESQVNIILHDSRESQNSNKIEGNTNYVVNKFENKLAIEVSRSENTSQMLLSSTLGPVMASEGFWEWTIQITNDKLYGLDEMLIDLDENSTRTTVFYKNMYDNNIMPLFVGYNHGKFNAIRINHQGPLEILILPSYLIVLRTLIGSKIEVELHVGPTPSDIYNQLLPKNTTVPELWSLGLHICRGGELDDIDKTVEEYKKFVELATFPYTSDCFHENVVNTLLKTTDDNKKETIYNTLQEIKSNKKLLISLPPQIPSQSSIIPNISDICYINPVRGEQYLGNYLEDDAVYPDFSNKNITNLITLINDEISTNNSLLPDGLVLTDNWPLNNEYVMSNLSFSYYLSDEIQQAMSNTIPWEVLSTDKVQSIYKHNEYGVSQLSAIQAFYDKENLFLMSSSQITYNLPSVVQNYDISWTNLKKAININLFNSMIGNNYVSIPVCGSTKNFDVETDESLCIRWYLMAVTMPLLRISSDFPRRDPTNLNTKYAADVAIEALEKRQLLLPHFYTILQSGEPLVRPMFYKFYEDENTLVLDEQYMIGDNILVAQPVLPKKKKLNVYLPKTIETWYEIWGGRAYKSNGWVTLDIVESDWISLIAHGSIIPTVKENELSFIIGLCDESSSKSRIKRLHLEPCNQNGSLYFESGTMDINLEGSLLTINGIDKLKESIVCNNQTYVLKEVKLYGISNTNTTNIEINLCNATNPYTFNITLPR